MFGFGSRRIYADAAAATPLVPQVKERLILLLDLFGNPGAIHDEGDKALKELLVIRKEAAEAIGAHANEIVFTASGTEANNLAIFGVATKAEGNAHIVTTEIEHPSVLEPLKNLEKDGVQVTRLPIFSDGQLDVTGLQKSITDSTVLVSIGLINSEIGAIQDIRAVAKIIRSARTLRQLSLDKARDKQALPLYFHVDASQAPLWMQLRVEHLGVDLMTLDAQKIMGPKGVGLLYVKRGIQIAPHILGGGQEGGLRSGTENIPLAGAFARALSLAAHSAEKNSERVAILRDLLWKEIQVRIPEAKINGSEKSRVANNLNISIPGLVGERAVIALSAEGISASTRSACAAKDEDLSHVIRALYKEVSETEAKQKAREAIRFTLLPSVTEREVKKIAQALSYAAKMYRNIDFVGK